jgi:hypothetical protein
MLAVTVLPLEMFLCDADESGRARTPSTFCVEFWRAREDWGRVVDGAGLPLWASFPNAPDMGEEISAGEFAAETFVAILPNTLLVG